MDIQNNRKSHFHEKTFHYKEVCPFFSSTKEDNSNYGIADWKKRNAFFIKCVSILLSIIFFHQQAGWTQEGKPVWTEIKSYDAYHEKLDNTSIDIPYDVANTQEALANGGDEVIINIQDAHASLAAQYSIAKLLDSLVANYDLEFIAIEGGSGYIDTSLLKTFPDKKVRDKAANILMEEGHMSAGEFFAVTHDESEIDLYGVEDDALYNANVESFRAVAGDRIERVDNINKLLKELENIERKVSSNELYTFSENCARHRDGEFSFSDHWKYIENLAENKKIKFNPEPELAKLVEAIRLEKTIDFSKANTERKRLIDSLSDIIGKAELEALVKKSLDFKENRISQATFHTYIIDLAAKHNIPADGYTNLIAFAEYVDIYESVDIVKLYRQMANLEKTVKEKLYRTGEEREFYALKRMLELAKKLYSLELTNDECADIESGYKDFTPARYASFIKDASSKYSLAISGDYDLSEVFNSIDEALNFYRDAEARNSAILANTVKRMRSSGKRVAALITGGYHTQGLTELMRQKKLSYLVVIPKFEDKRERPYIAILTNRKKPYEKVLETGKYQLAIEAIFRDKMDRESQKALFSLTYDLTMRDASIKPGERERKRRIWIEAYEARYDMLVELKGKRDMAKKMTPNEFRAFLAGKAAEEDSRKEGEKTAAEKTEEEKITEIVDFVIANDPDLYKLISRLLPTGNETTVKIRDEISVRLRSKGLEPTEDNILKVIRRLEIHYIENTTTSEPVIEVKFGREEPVQLSIRMSELAGEFADYVAFVKGGGELQDLAFTSEDRKFIEEKLTLLKTDLQALAVFEADDETRQLILRHTDLAIGALYSGLNTYPPDIREEVEDITFTYGSSRLIKDIVISCDTFEKAEDLAMKIGLYDGKTKREYSHTEIMALKGSFQLDEETVDEDDARRQFVVVKDWQVSRRDFLKGAGLGILAGSLLVSDENTALAEKPNGNLRMGQPEVLAGRAGTFKYVKRPLYDNGHELGVAIIRYSEKDPKGELILYNSYEKMLKARGVDMRYLPPEPRTKVNPGVLKEPVQRILSLLESEYPTEMKGDEEEKGIKGLNKVIKAERWCQIWADICSVHRMNEERAKEHLEGMYGFLKMVIKETKKRNERRLSGLNKRHPRERKVKMEFPSLMAAIMYDVLPFSETGEMNNRFLGLPEMLMLADYLQLELEKDICKNYMYTIAGVEEGKVEISEERVWQGRIEKTKFFDIIEDLTDKRYYWHMRVAMKTISGDIYKEGYQHNGDWEDYIGRLAVLEASRKSFFGYKDSEFYKRWRAKAGETLGDYNRRILRDNIDELDIVYRFMITQDLSPDEMEKLAPFLHGLEPELDNIFGSYEDEKAPELIRPWHGSYLAVILDNLKRLPYKPDYGPIVESEVREVRALLHVGRLLNAAKGLEVIELLKKKLGIDEIRKNLNKKMEFLLWMVKELQLSQDQMPDIYTAAHYVKILQTIPSLIKEGPDKGKYISTKYDEEAYYKRGEKIDKEIIKYYVVYYPPEGSEPVGKKKYKTFTPIVDQDGTREVHVTYGEDTYAREIWRVNDDAAESFDVKTAAINGKLVNKVIYKNGLRIIETVDDVDTPKGGVTVDARWLYDVFSKVFPRLATEKVKKFYENIIVPFIELVYPLAALSLLAKVQGVPLMSFDLGSSMAVAALMAAGAVFVTSHIIGLSTIINKLTGRAPPKIERASLIISTLISLARVFIILPVAVVVTNLCFGRPDLTIFVYLALDWLFHAKISSSAPGIMKWIERRTRKDVIKGEGKGQLRRDFIKEVLSFLTGGALIPAGDKTVAGESQAEGELKVAEKLPEPPEEVLEGLKMPMIDPKKTAAYYIPPDSKTGRVLFSSDKHKIYVHFYDDLKDPNFVYISSTAKKDMVVIDGVYHHIWSVYKVKEKSTEVGGMVHIDKMKIIGKAIKLKFDGHQIIDEADQPKEGGKEPEEIPEKAPEVSGEITFSSKGETALLKGLGAGETLGEPQLLAENTVLQQGCIKYPIYREGAEVGAAIVDVSPVMGELHESVISKVYFNETDKLIDLRRTPPEPRTKIDPEALEGPVKDILALLEREYPQEMTGQRKDGTSVEGAKALNGFVGIHRTEKRPGWCEIWANICSVHRMREEVAVEHLKGVRVFLEMIIGELKKRNTRREEEGKKKMELPPVLGQGMYGLLPLDETGEINNRFPGLPEILMLADFLQVQLIKHRFENTDIPDSLPHRIVSPESLFDLWINKKCEGIDTGIFSIVEDLSDGKDIIRARAQMKIKGAYIYDNMYQHYAGADKIGRLAVFDAAMECFPGYKRWKARPGESLYDYYYRIWMRNKDDLNIFYRFIVNQDMSPEELKRLTPFLRDLDPQLEEIFGSYEEMPLEDLGKEWHGATLADFLEQHKGERKKLDESMMVKVQAEDISGLLHTDRLLNAARGLGIADEVKKGVSPGKIQKELDKKIAFLKEIVRDFQKAQGQTPSIFTASHYVKNLQTVPALIQEGEYKDDKYISIKYNERDYYDKDIKTVQYYVLYNDELGKESFKTFTPMVDQDGRREIHVTYGGDSYAREIWRVDKDAAESFDVKTGRINGRLIERLENINGVRIIEPVKDTEYVKEGVTVHTRWQRVVATILLGTFGVTLPYEAGAAAMNAAILAAEVQTQRQLQLEIAEELPKPSPELLKDFEDAIANPKSPASYYIPPGSETGRVLFSALDRIYAHFYDDLKDPKFIYETSMAEDDLLEINGKLHHVWSVYEVVRKSTDSEGKVQIDETKLIGEVINLKFDKDTHQAASKGDRFANINTREVTYKTPDGKEHSDYYRYVKYVGDAPEGLKEYIFKRKKLDDGKFHLVAALDPKKADVTTDGELIIKGDEKDAIVKEYKYDKDYTWQYDCNLKTKNIFASPYNRVATKATSNAIVKLKSLSGYEDADGFVLPYDRGAFLKNVLEEYGYYPDGSLMWKKDHVNKQYTLYTEYTMLGRLCRLSGTIYDYTPETDTKGEELRSFSGYSEYETETFFAVIKGNPGVYYRTLKGAERADALLEASPNPQAGRMDITGILKEFEYNADGSLAKVWDYKLGEVAVYKWHRKFGTEKKLTDIGGDIYKFDGRKKETSGEPLRSFNGITDKTGAFFERTDEPDVYYWTEQGKLRAKALVKAKPDEAHDLMLVEKVIKHFKDSQIEIDGKNRIFELSIPGSLTKGERFICYGVEVEDPKSGKKLEDFGVKVEAVWQGKDAPISGIKVLEYYKQNMIPGKEKYAGNFGVDVYVLEDGKVAEKPFKTFRKLGPNSAERDHISKVVNDYADKYPENNLGRASDEELLNALFNVEGYEEGDDAFLRDVIDRALEMRGVLDGIFKQNNIKVLEQDKTLQNEILSHILYWTAAEDIDFDELLEKLPEASTIKGLMEYIHRKHKDFDNLLKEERYVIVLDTLTGCAKTMVETGRSKKDMEVVLRVWIRYEDESGTGAMNAGDVYKEIESGTSAIRNREYVWDIVKIGLAVTGILFLAAVFLRILRSLNSTKRIRALGPPAAGAGDAAALAEGAADAGEDAAGSPEEAGHGFAPKTVRVPMIIAGAALVLSWFMYTNDWSMWLVIPLAIISLYVLARSYALLHNGIRANMMVYGMSPWEAFNTELSFSVKRGGRYDTDAFEALPATTRFFPPMFTRGILQILDYMLEVFDVLKDFKVSQLRDYVIDEYRIPISKKGRVAKTGDFVVEKVLDVKEDDTPSTFILGKTTPGAAMQEIIKRHESIRNHILALPALYLPAIFGYHRILVFLGLGSKRSGKKLFNRPINPPNKWAVKLKVKTRDDIEKEIKARRKTRDDKAQDFVGDISFDTEKAFKKAHYALNPRFKWPGFKGLVNVDYRWNLWGAGFLLTGAFIVYHNAMKVWTSGDWGGFGISAWVVAAVFMLLSGIINRKLIWDKAGFIVPFVSGLTVLMVNLLATSVIGGWTGFGLPMWGFGAFLVISSLIVGFKIKRGVWYPTEEKQTEALKILARQLGDIIEKVKEKITYGDDVLKAEQWKEVFNFPVRAPFGDPEDAVNIQMVEIDFLGYLEYCRDWTTFFTTSPNKNKYYFFSKYHTPPYDPQYFLPTFWVKGPAFTQLRTNMRRDGSPTEFISYGPAGDLTVQEGRGLPSIDTSIPALTAAVEGEEGNEENLGMIALMPGTEEETTVQFGPQYNLAYEPITHETPHNGQIAYRNSYQTAPWDNILKMLDQAKARLKDIKEAGERRYGEDFDPDNMAQYRQASQDDKKKILYAETRSVDSFKGFGGPGPESSSYIKFMKRHKLTIIFMSALFVLGTYGVYIGKSVLMSWNWIPDMTGMSIGMHTGSVFLAMVTIYMVMISIEKLILFFSKFFGNPEAITDEDILSVPPRILVELISEIEVKMRNEGRPIPSYLANINQLRVNVNNAGPVGDQAREQVRNIIMQASLETGNWAQRFHQNVSNFKWGYRNLSFSRKAAFFVPYLLALFILQIVHRVFGLYYFIARKGRILAEEKPTLWFLNRLRLETPLLKVISLINRPRHTVIGILEERRYLTPQQAADLRAVRGRFTNEDVLEHLNINAINHILKDNYISRRYGSLLRTGIVMDTTFGGTTGDNLWRMAKSAVDSYPGGVDVYLIFDDNDAVGLKQFEDTVQKIRNDPTMGDRVADRIYRLTFPAPLANLELTQRSQRMKPPMNVEAVMAIQHDFVLRHREPPEFMELVDQEDVLGELNLVTKACIRDIRERHVQEQLYLGCTTQEGLRWGIDYDKAVYGTAISRFFGRIFGNTPLSGLFPTGLAGEYHDMIEALTREANYPNTLIDLIRLKNTPGATALPWATSNNADERIRYILWCFLKSAGTKKEFIEKEFRRRNMPSVIQSELRQVPIKDPEWSKYSYMDYLIWHSTIQTGQTRLGFLFLGGTGNNFEWEDLSGVIPRLDANHNLTGFDFINWRHYFNFLLRPQREEIQREETIQHNRKKEEGLSFRPDLLVTRPSAIYREWVNKYMPTGTWDLFNIIEDSELGSRIALRGQKSTRLEGLYTQILEDELPAEGIKWWLQRSRWISVQTFSAVISHRPAAFMFFGQHIFAALAWGLIGTKLTLIPGIIAVLIAFYAGGWFSYFVGIGVSRLFRRIGWERNEQWQTDPLKTMGGFFLGWWRFQNMAYLSSAAFAGLAAGITLLVTALYFGITIFSTSFFVCLDGGIFQLLSYVTSTNLGTIPTMENWLITTMFGIIFFLNPQVQQTLMGWIVASINAPEDEESTRQQLWARIEDRGFRKLFGFDNEWILDPNNPPAAAVIHGPYPPINIDKYRDEGAINQLLARYHRFALNAIERNAQEIQDLLIEWTPLLLGKDTIQAMLTEIAHATSRGIKEEDFVKDKKIYAFLLKEWKTFISARGEHDFYEFIERRAKASRDGNIDPAINTANMFLFNSWKEFNAARKKQPVDPGKIGSIYVYKNAMMQAITESKSLWGYTHGRVTIGLKGALTGLGMLALTWWVLSALYLIPAFVTTTFIVLGLVMIIGWMVSLFVSIFIDNPNWKAGRSPQSKIGRLAYHGTMWFLRIPLMLIYFSGMIVAAAFAIYTALSAWVNEAFWLRGRQRISVTFLPGDRPTLANYIDVAILKSRAEGWAYFLILVAFFVICGLPAVKALEQERVNAIRTVTIEPIWQEFIKTPNENTARRLYDFAYWDAVKRDKGGVDLRLDSSGLIISKLGLREEKKMTPDEADTVFKGALIWIQAYRKALYDAGEENSLNAQYAFERVINGFETFCQRYEMMDRFEKYFPTEAISLLGEGFTATCDPDPGEVGLDATKKELLIKPDLEKDYIWIWPDSKAGNILDVYFDLPPEMVTIDMEGKEFVFEFFVPEDQMSAFTGRSIKAFYVDTEGRDCDVGGEEEIIQYEPLPEHQREQGTLVRVNVAPDKRSPSGFNFMAKRFFIRIDGNQNRPVSGESIRIISPRVQSRISLLDRLNYDWQNLNLFGTKTAPPRGQITPPPAQEVKPPAKPTIGSKRAQKAQRTSWLKRISHEAAQRVKEINQMRAAKPKVSRRGYSHGGRKPWGRTSLDIMLPEVLITAVIAIVVAILTLGVETNLVIYTVAAILVFSAAFMGALSLGAGIKYLRNKHPEELTPLEEGIRRSIKYYAPDVELQEEEAEEEQHFQALIDPAKAPQYYSEEIVFNASGYTGNSVDDIKEYLREENGTAVSVEGPKIGEITVVKNFEADARIAAQLVTYGINIKQLIQKDLAKAIRIRGPNLFQGLEDREMSLVLLDKSPSIFEDHKKNNFIGINRVLFDKIAKNTSKEVLEILLITGILHELRHEAGEGDEEKITKEDVSLIISLAAQKGVTIRSIIDVINLVSGESLLVEELEKTPSINVLAVKMITNAANRAIKNIEEKGWITTTHKDGILNLLRQIARGDVPCGTVYDTSLSYTERIMIDSLGRTRVEINTALFFNHSDMEHEADIVHEVVHFLPHQVAMIPLVNQLLPQVIGIQNSLSERAFSERIKADIDLREMNKRLWAIKVQGEAEAHSIGYEYCKNALHQESIKFKDYLLEKADYLEQVAVRGDVAARANRWLVQHLTEEGALDSRFKLWVMKIALHENTMNIIRQIAEAEGVDTSDETQYEQWLLAWVNNPEYGGIEPEGVKTEAPETAVSKRIKKVAGIVIQHMEKDGWIVSSHKEELIALLKEITEEGKFELFNDPARGMVMWIDEKRDNILQVNTALIGMYSDQEMESILIHEMFHRLPHQIKRRRRINEILEELKRKKPAADVFFWRNEEGNEVRELLKRLIALRIRNEVEAWSIQHEYRKHIAESLGFTDVRDYYRKCARETTSPGIREDSNIFIRTTQDDGTLGGEFKWMLLSIILLPLGASVARGLREMLKNTATAEGILSSDENQFKAWLLSWIDDVKYCEVEPEATPVKPLPAETVKPTQEPTESDVRKRMTRIASEVIRHIEKDGWITTEYAGDIVGVLRDIIEKGDFEIYNEPNDPWGLKVSPASHGAGHVLKANRPIIAMDSDEELETDLVHETVHLLPHQVKRHQQHLRMPQELRNVRDDLGIYFESGDEADKAREGLKKLIALMIRNEFEACTIQHEYRKFQALNLGYSNLREYLEAQLKKADTAERKKRYYGILIRGTGRDDNLNDEFMIALVRRIFPLQMQQRVDNMATFEGVLHFDATQFNPWMLSWLNDPQYCEAETAKAEDVEEDPEKTALEIRNKVISAAEKARRRITEEGWITSEQKNDIAERLESFIGNPVIELTGDKKSFPLESVSVSPVKWALKVHFKAASEIPEEDLESYLVREAYRVLPRQEEKRRKIIEVYREFAGPKFRLFLNTLTRKKEQKSNIARRSSKAFLAGVINEEFEACSVQQEYRRRLAQEGGYEDLKEYLRNARSRITSNPAVKKFIEKISFYTAEDGTLRPELRIALLEEEASVNSNVKEMRNALMSFERIFRGCAKEKKEKWFLSWLADPVYYEAPLARPIPSEKKETKAKQKKGRRSEAIKKKSIQERIKHLRLLVSTLPRIRSFRLDQKSICQMRIANAFEAFHGKRILEAVVALPSEVYAKLNADDLKKLSAIKGVAEVICLNSSGEEEMMGELQARIKGTRRMGALIDEKVLEGVRDENLTGELEAIITDFIGKVSDDIAPASAETVEEGTASSCVEYIKDIAKKRNEHYLVHFADGEDLLSGKGPMIVPPGLEIERRREAEKIEDKIDPNHDKFFIVAPEGTSTKEEINTFKRGVMDLWMLEGVVSEDDIIILPRKKEGYTTSDLYKLLADHAKDGIEPASSNTGFMSLSGNLRYDDSAAEKDLLQLNIAPEAKSNINQYTVFVNLVLSREENEISYRIEGLEEIKSGLYIYLPEARAIDLEREVRNYYYRHLREILVKA